MGHINEKYINEYIRSITPERSSFLMEMEHYARLNHIPIIQPEVAQFLKVQLKMIQAKNILEVGTAIGYSAIVMAEATNPQCKITTIERRGDMIQLAKENIALTPYEDRIKIIHGEAEDVIPSLKESYDFIFLDAAKGHYLEFFNDSIKILQPGGLIISDNVLYRGMVATDSLVLRRQKTIVKRLREFLKYINKIEGYTSCVIPIGDGVALTYKR